MSKISSYQANVDFGHVIKTITHLQKPKKIIEFGILKGFSLQCFADTVNCQIDAYDIFEEFVGNKPDKDHLLNKFKDYPNVNIFYGDFYKKHSEIENNSVDILHVDIANNGDVLEFVLDNYMDKLTENGVVLFEGGSQDRDKVEWMIKYNKKPIRPVIEKYRTAYDFHIIEDFPSLTIIRSRNFKHIPLFKVFMSKDVLEPVNKTLMSGFITQGKQVERFEKELGDFIGSNYVCTLNSATAGLTLALKLLKKETGEWPGVKEDDIVLTPALTCFATNAAILANNCKIQWLDVDIETANICLNDLEKKLNEKTKVIYLVHWGGTPVNKTRLGEILWEHKKKYGFTPMIVEDCAHAFGAKYDGKMLGQYELVNNSIYVYSFQAIKHLTTGDGGMIVLPNKELYERCKLLRWYGIDRDKRNYKGKDFRLENDISEPGYKFHMNDINATIGLHNLPHIPEMLKKNRENAKYYNENLVNVKGVTLMKEPTNCDSAYWLFTMRVERKLDFIEHMKRHKIMVSQVHNRNDINSCVSEFKCVLPNLDRLEKELICIPVGWWVTKEDRERIVETIKYGW